MDEVRRIGVTKMMEITVGMNWEQAYENWEGWLKMG